MRGAARERCSKKEARRCRVREEKGEKMGGGNGEK